MRKKSILFIFIFFIASNKLFSQKTQGVNFDTQLNWNAIKKKAKREGKFIFVDCFATWCGTCKMMDNEVYSDVEVEKEFNKKFISIKLQMDKSSEDNEYVKSWYAVAEKFQQEFNFFAYPSFLFFSPEGRVVYRGFGYKSKESLIFLARAAVDPNKQYPVLKKNYVAGKITEAKAVREFIDVASENGDKNFAEKVAAKYKKDFIDELGIDKSYSLENFTFIKKYYKLVNSKDTIFYLFLNYPLKCDSLLPGLAKSVVYFVIEKEEITPNLNFSSPQSTNWDIISSAINRKYGKNYEELVLDARMRFAFNTKNWSEYVNLKDQEISNKAVSSKDSGLYSWNLNIAAWTTYLACDDSTTLTRALSWSDRSIQVLSSIGADSSEQYLDTKARILYKLGRKSEAIDNEQKAIELGSESARKSGANKSVFYNRYSAVLKKMKNGESITDSE